MQPAPIRHPHGDVFKRFKPVREVRFHITRDFTLYAARLYDARDHYVVIALSFVIFATHYSTISSTNRFFDFMPAARSNVRIALAVRPCFPITVPRSPVATFSSSTVAPSPSTSDTATA